MIFNNVPSPKPQREYLPKKPIFPHITPKCPKCQRDIGVMVCAFEDPKQYYCILCNKDFFYVGCLNCLFADHPPFSFKCIRCIRNPMPEEILDEVFFSAAVNQGLKVVSSPFTDRWKPYKNMGMSQYYD